MRAACEGVFGALFEWNLARWSGNEDMASFLTSIGLGLAISMNFLAMVGIAVLLVGPLTGIPRGLLGTIGVAPIAISYLVFVPRDRYVDVVRRFKRRTASEQRSAKIVAWTYIGISVVAHIVIAVAMYKR
jgi:hypothetical protein